MLEKVVNRFCNKEWAKKSKDLLSAMANTCCCYSLHNWVIRFRGQLLFHMGTARFIFLNKLNHHFKTALCIYLGYYYLCIIQKNVNEFIAVWMLSQSLTLRFGLNSHQFCCPFFLHIIIFFLPFQRFHCKKNQLALLKDSHRPTHTNKHAHNKENKAADGIRWEKKAFEWYDAEWKKIHQQLFYCLFLILLWYFHTVLSSLPLHFTFPLINNLSMKNAIKTQICAFFICPSLHLTKVHRYDFQCFQCNCSFFKANPVCVDRDWFTTCYITLII